MSAVEQLFTEIERPWSIDLGFPLAPSVNQFMSRLGNQSPVVRRWRKQADMAFMVQTMRGRRPAGIVGPYEIEITWADNKADISNRIKALEDYLEDLHLIENDRLCRRMLVQFGEAPRGCRVRLRAWGGA